MKYKLLVPALLLASAMPALAEISIADYYRGFPLAGDDDVDESWLPAGSRTGFFEGSQTGLNFDGIVSLEYENNSFYDFGFLGLNSDISYNAELGGALWGIGTKVLREQYFNGGNYSNIRPYISVEWGNGFAILGGADSAASFVKPNYSIGSVFRADAVDDFKTTPTILFGTEVGQKGFFAASYDERTGLSLAGIVKINQQYSVIAGVTTYLSDGYTSGYVGLTAEFDRARIWTTYSAYPGGGYYVEAQLDYAINDRLSVGIYGEINRSYSTYSASATYRLLNNFASGIDVDLVGSLSSYGGGFSATNLSLVARF